jgi:hypothetical protein
VGFVSFFGGFLGFFVFFFTQKREFLGFFSFKNTFICSLKICFKDKSLYYFHKKLKILKNQQNPPKNIFSGFLGGFFGFYGWFFEVFWVGFFGWFFLGGFFIANPACMRLSACSTHLAGPASPACTVRCMPSRRASSYTAIT